MKQKIIVIALSLLVAFLAMSGGYGFWEKYLVIRGNITVIRPTPVPKNVKIVIPVTDSKLVVTSGNGKKDINKPSDKEKSDQNKVKTKEDKDKDVKLAEPLNDSGSEVTENNEKGNVNKPSDEEKTNENETKTETDKDVEKTEGSDSNNKTSNSQ